MKKTSCDKKKKVAVALSGGVDSAFTAALLQKQGCQIVGVFLQLFDGKIASEGLRQAKKIAKKLHIPLKIVDARTKFKKKIIGCFLSSYKKGLTPNPCVVCNKEIKFRLLFELLKKYKKGYIATGHYARVKREFSIFNFQFSNNSKISKFQKTKLLEASDNTKDQSYFLYRLTQKDLSKIIFPLGEYQKTEVKKIAKKLGLSVSKSESQDICFVGDELNAFLGKNISLRPGNITNDRGKIIGAHCGLALYTLGQRKGIEIGGTRPYYVLGKNVLKNELIVTHDEKKLLTKKFSVKAANWIDRNIKFPLRADVRIRYHAPKISATIKKDRSGRYLIETKKPIRAVTPGQSAVFYRGEEVLGGGIIL